MPLLPPNHSFKTWCLWGFYLNHNLKKKCEYSLWIEIRAKNLANFEFEWSNRSVGDGKQYAFVWSYFEEGGWSFLVKVFSVWGEMSKEEWEAELDMADAC